METQRLSLDELIPAFAGRPHLAEIWRRLREEPEQITPLEQIEVLLAESRVFELKGDWASALSLAQSAVDRATNFAGAGLQVSALAQLGVVHFRFGHYPKARSLALEALSLDSSGPGRVHALILLGYADAVGGNSDAAEQSFLAAADLSRQIGFPLGRAQALGNVAQMVYAMRGQFDLALKGSAESWQVYVELGLPTILQQEFQIVIHWMKADRAQMRAALAPLAQTMLPNTRGEAYYFMVAGLLAIYEDDPDRAETCLERAHRLAETLGEPLITVRTRIGASICYRMLDQPAVALAWAQDAVREARRTGQPYLWGHALLMQARAFWAAGDRVAAEADLREAFEMLARIPDAFGLAHAAFFMAALQQAQAAPQAEATWLDAARRIHLGNYAFLLERERDVAYPLLAACLRSRNTEVRASAERLMAGLAQVAPRPLHVLALGRFQVWQGRRLVPERDWPRRRAGELLRFLLLQPDHAAARETVLEALWPDQPPASAQTQLHQATSTLRRLLEPDLPEKFPSRYLSVGAERLAIALPSGSRLDFVEFEQALNAALAQPAAMAPEDAERRVATLETALGLYRGELFPGDRYAEWPVPARERLAALHQTGLLALAETCLALNRPAPALEACRLVLAADPWREDAVLLGMRACLALNDRPGALRLYLDLERTLLADLQITPRDDLRSLAASLRNA